MALFGFLRGSKPEDRFAKDVLARLRRRGWQGGARYDADSFTIVLGEATNLIFLHNMFREWQQATAGQKALVIERVADTAFEQQAKLSFEEAAPRLIPAIYSRAALENQWFDPSLRSTGNLFEGATRPLCDALLVMGAIDNPTTISYVTAPLLAQWSVTLDRILEIAIENLRGQSACSFERAEGGFHISTYGDHHDAARILLPHLFAQLPLRGDPVAVVIARTALVVAGSEEAAALEAMAAFVDKALEAEARPISYLPIILRDGQWQPLDTSTERFKPLALLRLKQYLWDYTEQKKLLDGHFEREGIDIFVATFNVTEQDGETTSVAILTPGVDTLLPLAEKLLINIGESPRPILPWAKAEAICGPFLAEPGYYPPRFRVRQGPAAEVLERFVAAAQTQG